MMIWILALRTKAVSPLRSATAVQDASRGGGRWVEDGALKSGALRLDFDTAAVQYRRRRRLCDDNSS